MEMGGAEGGGGAGRSILGGAEGIGFSLSISQRID